MDLVESLQSGSSKKRLILCSFMKNPLSVSQLTTTRLVHHRKAPSHCLLQMKIKSTTARFFPPFTFSPSYYTKMPIYRTLHQGNKTIKKNKKKWWTPPHFEMQQRPTGYWERHQNVLGCLGEAIIWNQGVTAMMSSAWRRMEDKWIDSNNIWNRQLVVSWHVVMKASRDRCHQRQPGRRIILTLDWSDSKFLCRICKQARTFVLWCVVICVLVVFPFTSL